VRLRVNGEERELPDALTVAELLVRLELRAEGVAVAVDRQIVPRSTFADRRLAEGEQVEVLRAVGGG
jgi:sulfur carrier protein